MMLKSNKPFHPDDTGMHPAGWNKNGGGHPGGILSAFLPGQQQGIASALNQGFGGGVGQWRGILSDIYSPIVDASNFKYGSGVKDKKKGKQQVTTEPTVVGFQRSYYLPGGSV